MSSNQLYTSSVSNPKADKNMSFAEDMALRRDSKKGKEAQIKQGENEVDAGESQSAYGNTPKQNDVESNYNNQNGSKKLPL